MTIDFQAKENRYTYATREADSAWNASIKSLLDPQGKTVADIGCGGGIYSRQWIHLGASHVVGIDYSDQMLIAAKENTSAQLNIDFQKGSSERTGLPDESVNIVFERALIHHLKGYNSTFAEAYRLLTPGGYFLIQDRTLEDVLIAGSPEHIRGYFFELFPHLIEFERTRRPESDNVAKELESAGFVNLKTITLWEPRKTHHTLKDLQNDLINRTGRSILHALSDEELTQLVSHISVHVASKTSIKESDRWTIWLAEKPAIKQ